MKDSKQETLDYIWELVGEYVSDEVKLFVANATGRRRSTDALDTVSREKLDDVLRQLIAGDTPIK